MPQNHLCSGGVQCFNDTSKTKLEITGDSGNGDFGERNNRGGSWSRFKKVDILGEGNLKINKHIP